jgi:hypothetical protein
MRALGRFAMLVTVNFNDQAFAMSDEIQNVMFERRLTSNDEALRAVFAQLTPQDPLGLRGLATHLLGASVGHEP